jgi:hypothetical protein
MRTIFICLAAAGIVSVAACAGSQPDAVSSAPPTVSYRVTDNNLQSANAQAAQYCQGYGMAPQLQGVQPNGSERVAHYACVASAGTPPTGYGSSYGTPYGSTAVPPAGVKCADWMHQSRPGGSNYKGPPVPGCPQQ